MSFLAFLIAAVFLPLFPFGMGFSVLFERSRAPWLRAVLLLVWPQIGALALATVAGGAPAWLVAWAMISALFYAWRGLALREAGQWIGFLALSAWPLAWAAQDPLGTSMLRMLGISLPLALMSLITGLVETRFGRAHTALDLRLGTAAPRLAGLFVAGALAAIALPPSPGFFSLLALVAGQAPVSLPTALAVLAVWLLWTWSGMRLVQGIVIGPPRRGLARDIAVPAAWAYAALIVAVGAAGIALGGLLL